MEAYKTTRTDTNSQAAEMGEVVVAISNILRGKSLFLAMGALVCLLGSKADELLGDHNPRPEARSALLKLRNALAEFAEHAGQNR